MVELFPALLNPPAPGKSAEALVSDAESSCFYHPAKRAIAACESCGRFVCALCDVDLNGQHICPACLQTGKRKGKLKELENRQTRYDILALTLALAPLLVFYFTIGTAPAVIYIVIRYWNARTSVVSHSRWRMVLAFIIALIQIGGWIVAIYFIIRTMSTAGGSHR
jgi:hypothetical protein